MICGSWEVKVKEGSDRTETGNGFNSAVQIYVSPLRKKVSAFRVNS